MTLHRSACLLALAVGLTACESPTGPCDARYACEVTGADLAVTEMRLIAGEQLGTDLTTKLPVYAHTPLSFRVVVVNRGDTTSAPFGRIPALRPGEAFVDTITRMPDLFATQQWDDTAHSRNVDEYEVRYAFLYEDADPANNGRTMRFHVARPVIAIKASLGIRTEVRANSPFVVSFQIENRSQRASMDGISIVLCAVDYDIGCTGWFPTFGKIDLPVVHAGSRYENAHPVTMPMSSMVWPDAVPTTLMVCLVPASHTGPYIPLANDRGHYYRCTRAKTVMARPDLESCNPPVLSLGVTVAMTQRNCSHHPSRYPTGRFLVYALDAEAGRTYHVSRSVEVLDADGNFSDLPGPGISVATSGRYYLVDWRLAPTDLTLTAIE